MSLSPLRFVLCALPVLAVAIGCGSSEKTNEVKGKIAMPSSVKLVETDSVRVDFLPEDSGTKGGGTAEAKAPDFSFTIKAAPGKYKVSVDVTPYPGEKDSEKRSQAISNVIGAYQSGASSMRYEVTGDAIQTITIDLAKGTVNKN